MAWASNIPGNPSLMAGPHEAALAGAGGPRAQGIIGGKYRLIEPIGSGGIAVVWRARHDVLDTDVAVKIFNRHGDVENANRMLTEARAIAKLSHAAIVRVLDYGATDHDHVPFVVMELLKGEPLDTRLVRDGAIPAVDGVRLLLPILHGMAYAHERGILHRDLKPANVFLKVSDRGEIEPKLLDFGLAKLAGGEDDASNGLVTGTPDYMAPERICAEPDGPASDVWSAAVMLYETITRRLPFVGATQEALLDAIVTHPPAEPVELDPVLWRIIQRGLSKRPADRWPSMRDFGARLAEWLLGNGVSEDICGASVRATWFQGSGRFVMRDLAAPRRPFDDSGTRFKKTEVSSARRDSRRAWRRLLVGSILALVFASIPLVAWSIARRAARGNDAATGAASGGGVAAASAEPAASAVAAAPSAPACASASPSARPPSSGAKRAPSQRPARGKGGKFEDLGF